MTRFLPIAAGLFAVGTIAAAATGWFTLLSVAGGIVLGGVAMVAPRFGGKAAAFAGGIILALGVVFAGVTPFAGGVASVAALGLVTLLTRRRGLAPSQALLLAAVAATGAAMLAGETGAAAVLRQSLTDMCAIALVGTVVTAIAELAVRARQAQPFETGLTSPQGADWQRAASLALAGLLALAAAPLAASEALEIIPVAGQLALIALAQTVLIAWARDDAERQARPAPTKPTPEQDKSFALAVSIGHEIRQPLFAGQLAAHNLLSRLERTPQVEPETVRATTAKIGRHIDHAIAIADHTLELARFRSRPASLIDVAALIAGIIDAQRPLLESKAVTVSLTATETRRFESLADKTGLEQVLLNVIGNACDSIERRRSEGWHGQGRIAVILSRDARSITCTISDNGAGVDPRIAQTAFEPFVSTKTGKVGGLGLFLSREILRHGGGDITLCANADTGASVTITLPPAD